MDPPGGFASYRSYTNRQEAVMRAPLLGGLTIVALVALGSCKDDVGITVTERFAATLSGANVRPTPITSTATGSAQFTYVGDIKTLFFEVDVVGIDSVILAHIHGPADTANNNGVILNLYTTGKSKGLGFTGVLAAGVGGELGPPVGMTLDSLLVLMRNGHAYVNVHTVLHPAGEIRGQVVKQGAGRPAGRPWPLRRSWRRAGAVIRGVARGHAHRAPRRSSRRTAGTRSLGTST